MKDQQARAVINLLTKRLNELSKEVTIHQNPHPKDCKCDFCSGWTPDHFIVTFERGYASWWVDSFAHKASVKETQP
jgi:hypothetical protein